MKFNPISEQEADNQASDLWPAGEYDFEVRGATEKTSSAGNEMTELEVWVYDRSGGRRLCFDYLVVSEKAAWKIRSFAASCGLLPSYDSGSLSSEEMVGRTGRCVLEVSPASNGYPAKNKVKSYVKAAGPSRAVPSRGAVWDAPKVDDLDDRIPF